MKSFISMAFFLASFSLHAQVKQIEPDKSPMDMSYWPNNYPILKMNGKAKDIPVARVIYSRPLKNGRTIYGNIIKYGDVWRLGANEATEIEFFSNVKIGGKLVTKGRYTMYYIPYENKWTLVINRDIYIWGLYSYNRQKDVIRKDIDLEKISDPVESFTMYFEETRIGANLIIAWDDTKASLPITLVTK
jgi:hypothetical protein